MPAVTSVTNFSDGNVLTATALNAVNCGIHVYADAAARDAAYGGSGERTLVEGEYAYLLDTNQTLVYSGSNWVAVATAPGLVLIKTQVIGTTVGSVTVSDAFSATYDAYKIIITGGVSSASPAILRFTLGATVTNYYWAQNGRTFADVDNSGASGGAAVSWRGGGGSSKILNMNVDLVGPFLSEETYFTAQYLFPTSTGSTFNVTGFLDNTTSYTAFTLTPDSGTITGGTIRVYGYANS